MTAVFGCTDRAPLRRNLTAVTTLPPSRSGSRTTPRGKSLVVRAPDPAATSRPVLPHALRERRPRLHAQRAHNPVVAIVALQDHPASGLNALPPVSRTRAATASRRAARDRRTAAGEIASSIGSTAANAPVPAETAQDVGEDHIVAGAGHTVFALAGSSSRQCSAGPALSADKSYVRMGPQSNRVARRCLICRRHRAPAPGSSCRIDAGRGDEDAAIDDEQVLHVVAAAPFVDHRALGIGAHAGRAQQMPAAGRIGA